MALHINEFKRTELGEKRECVQQQQKDLCFLIPKAAQEFQLCYFHKQCTVEPAKNVQQAIVLTQLAKNKPCWYEYGSLMQADWSITHRQ